MLEKKSLCKGHFGLFLGPYGQSQGPEIWDLQSCGVREKDSIGAKGGPGVSYV